MGNSLLLLRVIKCVKLLRLLRVSRIYRYIQKLQEQIDLSSSMVRVQSGSNRRSHPLSSSRPRLSAIHSVHTPPAVGTHPNPSSSSPSPSP